LSPDVFSKWKSLRDKNPRKKKTTLTVTKKKNGAHKGKGKTFIEEVYSAFPRTT
jgi:hypothetical protein